MPNDRTKTCPRLLLCQFVHFVILFGLLVGSGASVAAAERDIAMSGQLFGGDVNGDSSLSLYGTATMPLFDEFNLHLEAVRERFDDIDTVGLAGHMFWRVGDRGLVGLTASRASDSFPSEDTALTDSEFITSSVGVEAEMYVQEFNFALLTGRIDSEFENLDKQAYTAFDISWNGGESWYLRSGIRTVADQTLNFVEVQYTPSSLQAPLTSYGGATWDSFESQWFGLQYWLFWSDKSNFSVSIELDQGEDGFDAFFIGVNYEFGSVESAPAVALFSTLAGGI